MHLSRPSATFGAGAPPAARRLTAGVVAAALLTSLVGFVAPAATAAAATSGGTFSTSFETADAAALVSTPYSTPVNVTGKRFGNGSLLASVDTVTASGENPPGEVALNAADADSSTKWLVRTNTGWLQYHLTSAQIVKQYKLTSANDTAGRDPKNFDLQGSNDGSSWTPLDTQTNQTFSARLATNTYAVANTIAYSYYRLNITANGGEPLIQLADWEILDGTNTPAAASPMTTAVGSGPVSGPNIKSTVGFTGSKALRYSGSHIAAGTASSTNVLYDSVGTTIGADTELSYKVFPVLNTDPTNLDYSATYIAVDLLLDDGTRVSAKGLTDQYGFGADASSQGSQKALYGNQWNSVRVALGSLAGKTVTKVLLSYDNPDGKASTTFSGWVDDVSLANATTIDGSSRTNYVDTRRGTNSSASFSRGNNIPATALPNGFNFFTPMTDAGSQSWLYNYASSNDGNNLPTLQAIGISHEPSPWMGDREQLAIMPSLATGQPNATLATRALEFNHNDEVAQPDLYSVKFTNGISAAVTPSDHAGVMSFTYPGTTGTVMVDKVAADSSLSISSSGVVTGWVEGGSGLSAGNSRMFVYGVFDTTPTATGTATGRTSATYANFALGASKKVELRIATSFISSDQAKQNMDLEVTGKSFDDVRAAAKADWNDRFSVIDVEGASQSQKVTLYSSLYRLNLYPNSQSENTGSAAAPHWQYASPVSAKTTATATATTTNAKIVDGQIYVNNGFWDTYRTVWPLYSLLYPDIADKLVDGFVQQYRDGGSIARWSSPGYADLMTGTSSDAAFAEAYTSGSLTTPLALEAFDAAVKNATVLPTSNAVGRKGLDTSEFLGYTSTATGESVSWGLEGYINDYAIGKMAAKLAVDPQTPASRVTELNDDSAYFLKRAQDYVNMFDPSIDFFQGKTMSGAFAQSAATYDPKKWGGDYTETDGWNFAFHAPFDVDGLAALYGGTDGLVDKLDTFFSTPETAFSSGIHEAFEARDVRMGQLGMSNQVSHHIPYMYAGAGDPSKTQAKVREIMQRLFVGSEIGQGYPGDEDNGEFSSWFVFSALGFYPLALASGQYTIGSPLFDKATVHLAGGDLVINAANNSSKNVYIQSAELNGKALNSATIDESALKGGATLDFQMGATPSSWGDRTSTVKDARTPYVDTTGTSTGVVTASDSTDLTNLVDDNSRSAVTFTDAAPAVTWESTSGPAAIASYTITNGVAGTSAPKSWTLSGSNDGEHWTQVDQRSDETFTWATQTRPFEVSSPTLFSRYKLAITDTSSGPATVAEVELLADTQQQSTSFELYPRTGLATDVDKSLTAAYATFTGGSSTSASDYDATVDFLDGTGPHAATVSKSKLGSLQVTLPHAWADAGVYTARVTVTDGDASISDVVTVKVSHDQSLVGAFNNACITVNPTAANCDSLGYAYDKASLAASGFIQGSTVTVPGTALTFDLPDVASGKNDNALAQGQVITLHPGAGVTKLSVIGTANETAQHETGTVTFSDGTTQSIPIDFGDWVGTSSAPAFGNIVVGTTTRRLAGTGVGDTQHAAIFATAPLTLTAGKTPVSLTLPNQTGSLGDGLIHVFAIATDGTRTPPATLAITASDVDDVMSHAAVTAKLATVTGGDPVGGTYSTTINWGDETPVDVGTADAVDGGTPISGSHEYAMSGDYTVSVTVDDGEKSATTSTTISVDYTAYTPTLAITQDAIAPGHDVTFTGTGFKKGESVAVTISTDPAIEKTVTADADGSISVTVTVPADAMDATYPVSAIGAKSKVAATGSLAVRAPKRSPQLDLALSAAKAQIGDDVTATATVATGASGSVQFFDGGIAIGAVPVSGGKALLHLGAIGTGDHAITAVYSGDDRYLAGTSSPKTVTITKGAVTLAVPTFSKKSQLFGSSSVASVATTVLGATSGTVTFVSGSTVIAKANISGGRASAKLSKTLAAGNYQVVASYSETATSSAFTSTAAAFTVTKATTSKVSVSGKKFAKNSKPVVTVKVAKLNNGNYAAGRVAVYVGSTKVRTVTLAASKHGTIRVTLPKKYSKSISVKAKFVADSVVSKVSKKVTVRVK